MDKEQRPQLELNVIANRVIKIAYYSRIGLEEALADLRFIRTATKDAHISALAGSAALVAELYLKQAKGETK
jgi:hypothetical protein